MHLHRRNRLCTFKKFTCMTGILCWRGNSLFRLKLNISKTKCLTQRLYCRSNPNAEAATQPVTVKDALMGSHLASMNGAGSFMRWDVFNMCQIPQNRCSSARACTHARASTRKAKGRDGTRHISPCHVMSDRAVSTVQQCLLDSFHMVNEHRSIWKSVRMSKTCPHIWSSSCALVICDVWCRLDCWPPPPSARSQ